MAKRKRGKNTGVHFGQFLHELPKAADETQPDATEAKVCFAFAALGSRAAPNAHATWSSGIGCGSKIGTQKGLPW